MRYLTLLTLIGLFFFYEADAQKHSQLQYRLDKVKHFSANYEQTVTSPDGCLIQSSSGKLWISKPALFRWETKLPEANLYVSDGKTMWSYTPAIKQATATHVKNTINNSLFWLIFNNEQADWQNYYITQKKDQFELVPRRAKDQHQLQKFSLTIDSNGIIKQFTVLETDGQRSCFILKNFCRDRIKHDLFSFHIPHDVIVDDQR